MSDKTHALLDSHRDQATLSSLISPSTHQHPEAPAMQAHSALVSCINPQQYHTPKIQVKPCDGSTIPSFGIGA